MHQLGDDQVVSRYGVVNSGLRGRLWRVERWSRQHMTLDSISPELHPCLGREPQGRIELGYASRPGNSSVALGRTETVVNFGYGRLGYSGDE